MSGDEIMKSAEARLQASMDAAVEFAETVSHGLFTSHGRCGIGESSGELLAKRDRTQREGQ